MLKNYVNGGVGGNMDCNEEERKIAG